MERGVQRGKPLGAGESPRFVGFFLSPAPIRLSPLRGVHKLTEVTKAIEGKKAFIQALIGIYLKNTHLKIN